MTHPAPAPGRRRSLAWGLLWVGGVGSVACVAYFVWVVVTLPRALVAAFERADGCAGCRAAHGAYVMRGERVVSAIVQVAEARRDRPLPLYLAPLPRAWVDSLRAGRLAAREATRRYVGGTLVLDLVPPAVTRGRRVTARLVIAPGEASVPVYADGDPGRPDT